MKKLLSLLLAAAMVCALGVVPRAEEVTSDQELKTVTALVKNTLGMDTGAYTDFNGQSSDDLLVGRRWYLNWSGEGIYLSVTADSAGKIYSFTRSDTVSEEPVYLYNVGGTFRIPSLPEDKGEQALQTARDFLDRVLEEGVETVELADRSQPSLYRTAYHFYGTVKCNGVEAPITVSLTVRPQDLAVTRFWRSDQYSGYLGDLPAGETQVSEAQARLLLKRTVDMEAKYLLSDDGKTATVHYVPLSGDDYYVDGATGELVDLTQLREKLSNGAVSNKFLVTDEMAEPEASTDASVSMGLTQAELDGAAKLAGALDKEELARVVTNAWPELGLKDYTLSGASYSVTERKDSEDSDPTYDVTCRLVFNKADKGTNPTKTVTVDAKTGTLQQLYTSRYYQDKGDITYRVTLPEAENRAGEFLRIFAPDHYPLVDLTDSYNPKGDQGWQYSFTFTHTAYGYCYESNTYTVCVDGVDGTISALYPCFDDTVELVDPGSRLISKTQAIAAYTAAMDLPYTYLEVPVPVTTSKDRALVKALQSSGYEYVLALRTGYTLAQPSPAIRGVDIVTGEVVYSPEPSDYTRSVTYDDLEGSWVQEAAQALAKFNVGFLGGSLQPEKTLTQLDMVALLCSVDGYLYDPDTAGEEELDWLYQRAYTLGFVTPDTREEDRTVTRGELVKLILDGAGFGKIAALSQIFRCTFSDAQDIPAHQLGYAALAQGLGLVKGDGQGAYAADRIASRAEAVAMLYQYMK